jgi:hypothetical protein
MPSLCYRTNFYCQNWNDNCKDCNIQSAVFSAELVALFLFWISLVFCHQQGTFKLTASLVLQGTKHCFKCMGLMEWHQWKVYFLSALGISDYNIHLKELKWWALCHFSALTSYSPSLEANGSTVSRNETHMFGHILCSAVDTVLNNLWHIYLPVFWRHFTGWRAAVVPVLLAGAGLTWWA